MHPNTDLDASLADLKNALAHRELGHTLIYIPSLDSTNTYARDLAQAGALHGTIVLTDEQHKGRGSKNRIWHSPPRVNIYTSLILRPPLSQNLSILTLMAGVAVAEAIQNHLFDPTDLGLKWPNDVRIGGKKIAGILTESVTSGQSADFVILGIGININQVNFPPELNATSLFQCLGHPIDRIAFLKTLYPTLEIWYNLFALGDFKRIVQRWKALSDMLGKRILVSEGPDQVWTGIARDLSETGALIVESPQGLRALLSGDIETP